MLFHPLSFSHSLSMERGADRVHRALQILERFFDRLLHRRLLTSLELLHRAFHNASNRQRLHTSALRRPEPLILEQRRQQLTQHFNARRRRPPSPQHDDEPQLVMKSIYRYLPQPAVVESNVSGDEREPVEPDATTAQTVMHAQQMSWPAGRKHASEARASNQEAVV